MKKKGFTLIELLVVIAIIGLLSTLAVVALNSARSKARDAKRISDVKQIQTALELYYNDNSGYAAGTLTLGVESDTKCLGGTGGFQTLGCTGAYMGLVPSNPNPNGAAYYYSSDGGDSYSIVFELEGTTGGLGSGPHTASEMGIR
ncbi:MAG: hypothetical protein CMI53_01130 [Parcubacteria group bacterium]|nr:hypothetical protein [Parcubacteria group bacterium]|tara:strand:- start:31 stop:465 length:435 start_codon:yes stop_codon:yes gene_type:complete